MTRFIPITYSVKTYLPACLALLLAALVLWPEMAFAAQQPMSVDDCVDFYGGNGSFQPWDYTSKVVFCLRGAIINATGSMLSIMCNYLATFVGGLFTLATMMFGIRIASGERELSAKAVGFLLRLAVVGFFALGLGGYSGLAFGALDDLVSMVSGGYWPFPIIDKILGKIVGFGPNLLLAQGLIGLVSASLFSSSVGFTMFTAGIFAMINLLTFIYNIVFTYIKALLIIGFMLIISPLFVPMAIFFYTERYMKKWLDIIFSAILVVVLMFAFLNMFMSIFIILVTNIFEILGAKCGNPMDLDSCPVPNFGSMWKMMQPLYSWLMPGDPNMSTQLQQLNISGTGSSGEVLNVPPVASNINPLLSRGMNANAFNFPGVNFGPNTVYITQQLTFSLLSMWFFATIMKNMLSKIPSIASGIASATSGLVIESTGFKEKLMGRHGSGGMLGNLKAGVGAAVGGSAGGAAGDMAARLAGTSRAAGRQTGGVLGAFGGAIFGARKL